ncbi:hypothetical protein Y032_0006g2774 [Ancylostoma ceylanicum]|uniref:Uncharacterized protein n=1 Tax=Ancylostoma ceylanicum TaxID=53326 RepID=A0A016VNW9_9BILA|nr:hypothetical protein Y032_0006g2774 [Ancylostoma ceylanicum]
MEFFERTFRRNRIKTQYLVVFGCLSLITYAALRANRSPSRASPSATDFHSSGEHRRVDVGNMAPPHGRIDENPGGLGDGEFPELKKEYEDNLGHREEHGFSETEGIEEDQKVLEEGKNERDSGNDIASLPAHSREHVQFVEEVPNTINATTDLLENPSSTASLAGILGVTSTHGVKNGEKETAAERQDGELNLNYADGLQEQTTVDDDDVKLNEFQNYPTEESTADTTTVATIIAPSTFNSTSLEDFEKSVEKFVAQTSTESIATGNAQMDHITTVAYNFSMKPEDNGTTLGLDRAEAFRISEKDPMNEGGSSSRNEQPVNENIDTLGGADRTGDEREKFDANDISQFII